MLGRVISSNTLYEETRLQTRYAPNYQASRYLEMLVPEILQIFSKSQPSIITLEIGMVAEILFLSQQGRNRNEMNPYRWCSRFSF